MPKFSAASRSKLETCDDRLQRVFNKVITEIDCTILEGHRSYDQQLEYYRTGRSKLNPDDPTQRNRAMHLRSPALAVDALPCPIDWQDAPRIAFFAGYVLATARDLGVALLWGGNWDRSLSTLDRSSDFFDGPHFEIME